MSAARPGSMRGPRVKTPLLLLRLLLPLLLLSALSGTVLCQDEGDDGEPEALAEGEDTDDPNPELVPELAPESELEPGSDVQPDSLGDEETQPSETPPTESSSVSDAPPPDEGVSGGGITDDNGSGINEVLENTDLGSTGDAEEGAPDDEEGLSPIIIMIPVVLVVLIIGMIVCGIFINRRWNNKARDQELRKEDPYLDGSSTEKVPMPMFEEDVPSVLELEMEELDQWMKKDGETAGDSNQV